MKPPAAGPGLDPAVISHHQGQATRHEDPSPHPDKQAANLLQMKDKMKPPTPKTTQTSSSNPASSSFSGPHHQYSHPHPPHSAFGESPIPLPPGKSHMEALRAHAHSASSGIR